jgi:APA family basic amino acid/polyamine antiporter
VLVSVVAGLHVVTLYYARLTYAFARDGLFFPWLGSTSRWSRIPVRAVVANGALGVALALIGSFDTLTNYMIFNLWVFFALIGTTIFVFRRRLPPEQRPYEVWGYPIVPALFVAAAFWLLIQTAVTSPMQSLIGIAIVVAGLPVYWYRSRRRATTTVANYTT